MTMNSTEAVNTLAIDAVNAARATIEKYDDYSDDDLGYLIAKELEYIADEIQVAANTIVGEDVEIDAG